MRDQDVRNAMPTLSRMALADKPAPTVLSVPPHMESPLLMISVFAWRSVTRVRPVVMEPHVLTALPIHTRTLLAVTPAHHARKDSPQREPSELSLLMAVMKSVPLVSLALKKEPDVSSVQITPSRLRPADRTVTHVLRALRLKEASVVTPLMTVLNNADLARRVLLMAPAVSHAHSTHTRSWRDVSHVSHAKRDSRLNSLELNLLTFVLKSVMLVSPLLMREQDARNALLIPTRRSKVAVPVRSAQRDLPHSVLLPALSSLHVLRSAQLVRRLLHQVLAVLHVLLTPSSQRRAEMPAQPAPKIL